MEERIVICPRCSWIHVDGGGDFCNGCGAPTSAGGVTTAATAIPTSVTLGVDLALGLLIVLVLGLLIAAAI